VDFRQADIFDLPADLTVFGLIYCSWAAICWVPDLTVFADRLRPGGSVLLAEHHLGSPRRTRRRPSLRPLRPLQPYDAAHRDRQCQVPTGARDNPDTPAFSAFIWPTIDVVMSLITVGLHLDTFFESPAPALYVIKTTEPHPDVSHETSTANP
jgi:SAM-dependent methyltransferase